MIGTATIGPRSIDDGILLFVQDSRKFRLPELIAAVQSYAADGDWEIYPRLHRMRQHGKIVYTCASGEYSVWEVRT